MGAAAYAARALRFLLDFFFPDDFLRLADFFFEACFMYEPCFPDPAPTTSRVPKNPRYRSQADPSASPLVRVAEREESRADLTAKAAVRASPRETDAVFPARIIDRRLTAPPYACGIAILNS